MKADTPDTHLAIGGETDHISDPDNPKERNQDSIDSVHILAVVVVPLSVVDFDCDSGFVTAQVRQQEGRIVGWKCSAGTAV